jgi:RimJ/RimL family protein N-acetyltransferase
MKLPYLGIHNPLLALLDGSLTNNNGRQPSPRSSIAGSRFQLTRPVPNILKGETWQLCPLQINNAATAYEAYLTNPEAVIQHSPHTHLVEPYTWQAHQEHVARCVQAHQTHAGFTYILLDTETRKCLGCVQVQPLRPFLRYNNAPPHLIILAGDNAAMITYWLTPSHMSQTFHTSFISRLHNWLTHEWGLLDHFFRISHCQKETIALMEMCGLKTLFCLPTSPHRYIFMGSENGRVASRVA